MNDYERSKFYMEMQLAPERINLRNENIKLKNILKEIREYCNTYTRLSAKELLDIIEKGIGSDR